MLQKFNNILGSTKTVLVAARDTLGSTKTVLVTARDMLGSTKQLVVVTVVLIALLCGIANATVRDSFESDEPTFRLVERDCEVLLGKHHRSIDHFHSGQVSEHLYLRCGQGTKVYFAQPIEPAYVIEELSASLWVKSDRPGVQIIARVKLPRTRDPDTGGAMRTLVFGSSYRDVGSWEELKVGNFLKTLRRDEKVKRAKFGSQVDIREAYVDMIVLNVYGGRGTINVWMDDLEIDHHVSAKAAIQKLHESSAPKQSYSAPKPFEKSRLVDTTNNRVELAGSHFKINDKPAFLRAIEHNGESLEWLKQHGFNCVHLAKIPTARQIEIAERIGLWLVAPPPDESSQDRTWQSSQIVAWDLQSKNDDSQFRAIRNLDRRLARPILTKADDDLRRISPYADLVLLPKQPMGAAMTFREHRHWLLGQIQKLPTAVQSWCKIPTHVDGVENVNLDLEQVRLAAFNSITVGCRGIVFCSQSRLDGRDEMSRLRALLLKLVNFELEAIDPWLAGGVMTSEITTSDPQVHIFPLRTERSQLLVALRQANDQQFVCDMTQTREVTFVPGGGASSGAAYEYSSLTGLKHLKYLKHPGDRRVRLDGVSPVSLIVMTHNQLVVGHLSRRYRESSQSFAEALNRYTANSLDHVATICTEFERDTLAKESNSILRHALSHLQRSEHFLQLSDFATSSFYSQQCLAQLSALKKTNWDRAAKSMAFPSDAPHLGSFDTLPVFWASKNSPQSPAASRE